MLAGDEAAFDELIDGYVPRLFRFALARLRGDEDLAQELVQATVCKCVTRLAGFRRQSSLFTWLCSCCLNEIRMHFRSKARRPVHVELDEGVAASAPLTARPEGPESTTMARERARLVHRALDELSPRHARALEWMYLERVPVAEIARRLAIGDKAAESLLTRARAAFRSAYGGLTGAPGARDWAAGGTLAGERRDAPAVRGEEGKSHVPTG
jgi:RNA polymerase sigma-70 factor (ECF subfamily)